MSVGSGFIAARTTTSSPFVTPPSSPPARLVARCRPGRISSCASEPRAPRKRDPSPISTALTAWMPISAPASRASRRSSRVAYEPSPGGTPVALTSTMPPSVSRSSRAASTARRAPPRRPRRRLDHVARRPDAELGEERLRDRARRDQHGGLARAGALEGVADVFVAELERAGRSACPGRGSVTGFVPLPCGSPSGGHGLIPHAQFSWSRLRTTRRAASPACARGAGRRAPRPASVLDALARAPAVPLLAAREVGVDRLAVEREPGRQAGDDPDERGPVRLARPLSASASSRKATAAPYRAAARMTSSGAGTPVQSSNDAAPCATSTSRPSSTRAPAARAASAPSQTRGRAGRPASGPGGARRAPASRTGVALTTQVGIRRRAAASAPRREKRSTVAPPAAARARTQRPRRPPPMTTACAPAPRPSRTRRIGARGPDPAVAEDAAC